MIVGEIKENGTSKMTKNSNKCKNPKTVKMRIGPYSFPRMLIIISDGKKRATKHTKTARFGGAE